MFKIMIITSIVLSVLFFIIAVIYVELIYAIIFTLIFFSVSGLFLGFFGFLADLEIESQEFWDNYYERK